VNRAVKFFYDKDDLNLLKVMVAVSLVLHLIAMLILGRYGLAKPGRRIVTIKMVQQAKEPLKTSGNKGAQSSGGGSAQEAAKPAEPSRPSAPPPTQAARTEAIRKAVSKKGLLSVMGKNDVVGSGRASAGANFDTALSRAASSEGWGTGTGSGSGNGSGSGSGKDEWAGMGVDTGGFASTGVKEVAAAPTPQVAKLEKSRDLKVESNEDRKKTEELTNKEVLEIIKRTVESYLGGLRYSYNKQLRKNPDLQGRVTVAITINPKGQVEEVKVNETTMNNPEMEQEILAKIRHWSFPAILHKTTTVTYPFVFFPPT